MSFDVLTLIHAEQRSAGEQVFPPATHAACDALRSRLEEEISVTVPDAFLAFLRRSDGLDFNGLVLYGTGGTADQRTPDLVASNLIWRTNVALRDWLILGDSDTDLLAWHQRTGACERLDRVGLQVTEAFPDVATMLRAAMQERL